MPTEAQINANRENAKHSTGPVRPEGRATVSENPIEHALSAKRDFVRPEEYHLYNAIAAGLKNELNPGSLLESIHFAEALTATWRLHRCGRLEADLADQIQVDPMLDSEHRNLQQSIDRARTQAHNLVLKATKEIAKLKKETPRTEDAAPVPLLETRVHETKEEILARIAVRRAEKKAAAGKTEQTQSTPSGPEEPVEQFRPSGQNPIAQGPPQGLGARQTGDAPVQPGPAATTCSEQTESAPRNTPRNAPCPCNSGKKYKRCCGFHREGSVAQAA